MSLRRRVQGLVAAAVLPLAGLLIYDAYTIAGHLAQQAETSALTEARLLAGNVEALVDGARQAATAIAAHIESNLALTNCPAYLQAVVSVEPRYFAASVFGADGELRCSNVQTPRPISITDRPYFHAALSADGLVLGELITERASGRPALPLAVAYRNSNGDALGVVVLPVDVAALARLIAAQVQTDGAYAMVLDSRGAIAAHVPQHAAMVGQRLPDDEFRGLWQGGARVVENIDPRQRRHIAAVVPVPVAPTGLLVMVALDRAVVLAPARVALLRNLVIAALAAAAAAVAAWLVGSRLIEAPIRRFVDTAQRRAAGDLAAAFPTAGADSDEFGRLGTALNAMAGEIDRLVEQKSLLLRELQHRVMNSLQLLSAFLHLQARQVDSDEVRRHLAEARERIVSMSAIYRHLYQSEATTTVEFGGALRVLCEETSRAYLGGHLASIEVQAETVVLPVERALSLALITHELLTNALKHAYDRGGPLQVELQRRDDLLELAVCDRGRGLPEGFSFEAPGSLGMKVVSTLARQLRGTVTAERRDRGTRFVVRVPLATRRRR